MRSFGGCLYFRCVSLDRFRFRRDLDPKVETVAIAELFHVCSALGRGWRKGLLKQDSFRHIEEVYMAIQRSAEVGVKN